MAEQGPTASGGNFIMLERWSQFAAVVTGATVVFSVLYNWAYFEVAYPAGIQLMSITDHVTSALEWIPQSLFLYAWSVFIALSSTPSHRASTNASNATSEARRWQVIMARIILRSWRFLRAAGPTGLVLGIYFFSDRTEWWATIAAISLVLFLYLSRLERDGRIKWPYNWYAAVTIVFIGYSLEDGNRSGLRDFLATTGDAAIVTKQGDTFDDVVLLRQLDRGVLFRPINQTNVSFLKWDDVAKLTALSDPIDQRWRICVDFKLFCGDALHKPVF